MLQIGTPYRENKHMAQPRPGSDAIIIEMQNLNLHWAYHKSRAMEQVTPMTVPAGVKQFATTDALADVKLARISRASMLSS